MKSSNNPPVQDNRPHLSTRKKLVFTALTVLGMLLVTEVAARAVYYVKEGFNPYYLYFGFVTDTQYHSADGPGYSKFQPNTIYHQKTAHRTVDMSINANGFRNPENFVIPKPAGTFRILTLGESSTFGYGLNEDNQTYPEQLQDILRLRYPGQTIQVYNLGIPHFRSNNILALAKAEVPGLQPNLITLYSGFNNALLVKPQTEAGLIYRTKDWFYFHSVAWRVIHTTVRDAYYQLVKVTNTDPVGLPNLAAPAELSRAAVEKLREAERTEYVTDISALADEAEKLHVPIIFITQKYTLRSIKGSGLEDKWRTYPEEIEFVEGLYKTQNHLSAIQASLLIHRDMMDGLRKIAADRHIPLVEGIAALDVNAPEAMGSYVHLTPVGNHMLATAIADGIGQAGILTTTTSQGAVVPALHAAK